MRPITNDVPLSARTTLRLGGRAARFQRLDREADLPEILREADARGEPVLVLGGGSNLVVADEGFPGLVLHIGTQGVKVERREGGAIVDVAAGEDWDAFVGRAVEEGWGGVESLAGIPGLVGGTPIQNVGAYGREVGETIRYVRVFDRVTGEFATIPREECGFGYRASRFKRNDRFVVVGVGFAFPLRATASVRYAELARALGVNEGDEVPARALRETVITLRRGKGMVLDPGDPESTSAGSFFVNPVVDEGQATAVERRARDTGVLGPTEAMPRFAAGDRRCKLAAAWLVERAGFRKGYGDGPVGVSRKHSLALVNRSGGTTRELLALARAIRDGVRARLGVELEPEPVFVGCSL
jgi:UDP-N-acetylmuramate dehydrogenase